MLAIQRFSATGAIDAAVWAYRQNFSLLFSISLMVALPTGLVSALISPDQTAPAAADPARLLVSAAILIGIALVASAFATAASTRAASSIALGRTPSLGQTLAETVPVFGRALGATLLITFALGLVAVVGTVGLAIPVALLTPSGGGGKLAAVLLGVLGGCGLLVVLGALSIRWSLAIPVIALEPASAFGSLRRSSELTRGRRGKILAVLAIYLVLLAAVQGGSYLIGLAVPGEGQVTKIVQALLSSGTSALVSPVMYLSVALLYYDARVEHEAFDVEMLARQSQPAGAGT